MSSSSDKVQSILFSTTNLKQTGAEKKDSKESKEVNDPKTSFLKICGVTLHNDDDDGSFSDIISQAEVTITDNNNNKTLFSGKMSVIKDEGFIYNFKAQFNPFFLFNSKEAIDEKMQACIKKGLIEAASFPIKISVKARTYDRWDDNMRYSTRSKTLTIEKLSSKCVEDGFIQISFQKFNLKESEAKRNKCEI